ncbi:hypothetical protein [Photorhabdus kayaii]|uniref:hypothetical protein n=1 Tax=Photorhabdus kayaii TaxID=230088 RepID=UPI0021D50A14|nr:hypothetical protein [Photorhabdus kayaii]MCT8354054.1 hypothetical protein [Photorhabdus kayaii]
MGSEDSVIDGTRFSDGRWSYTDTPSSRHSHDNGSSFKQGGGNGGGGDMEARVARLESDVEHIKKSIDEVKTDVREMRKDARSDFRLLFGAIIAVALGLAGLMAKGFHWI